MNERHTPVVKYIRACASAARRLKNLLERVDVYPSSTPSSLVPFAFLNKAFRLHQAVLTLCRNGFGSEAYGLSRTMIEMFIALRWITNRDAERRGMEYGLFSAKRKKYLMQTGPKYIQPSKEWKQAVKRAEAEVDKQAARYKSFTFWANISGKLKGLAAEPEELDKSDLKGNDALWDYEIPFSMASDHVHATAIAVDEFIPPRNTPFRVNPVRSDSQEEMALFNSTIYLFKLVRRVDSARKLGLSVGIGRVFQTFATQHRRFSQVVKRTRTLDIA